jgi:hypothetical protein
MEACWLPAMKCQRCVWILVFALAFVGCEKKSGEGIVLDKEHIPAAEISDNSAPSPAASPGENEHALAADEITIDQYVMKRSARGTSRDPRATDREQWMVKVRLTSNERQFTVRVDQSQWQKLKAGDRVTVTYRQGKYTGTIWSAEIR